MVVELASKITTEAEDPKDLGRRSSHGHTFLRTLASHIRVPVMGWVPLGRPNKGLKDAAIEYQQWKSEIGAPGLGEPVQGHLRG